MRLLQERQIGSWTPGRPAEVGDRPASRGRCPGSTATNGAVVRVHLRARTEAGTAVTQGRVTGDRAGGSLAGNDSSEASCTRSNSSGSTDCLFAGRIVMS